MDTIRATGCQSAFSVALWTRFVPPVFSLHPGSSAGRSLAAFVGMTRGHDSCHELPISILGCLVDTCRATCIQPSPWVVLWSRVVPPVFSPRVHSTSFLCGPRPGTQRGPHARCICGVVTWTRFVPWAAIQRSRLSVDTLRATCIQPSPWVV